MKKFLTTLLLIIIAKFAFSQQDSVFVFKLKWQFRHIVQNEKITDFNFHQLLSEFGNYSLRKTFPTHTTETDRNEKYKLASIYTLNFHHNINSSLLLKKIKKIHYLNYFEPYIYPQLCYTPSDTLLPQQYYLNLIQALQAWDIEQGNSSVVIGITDTGWDPSHPDLSANIKLNTADPVNGVDDDNDGYIDNYMGWDVAMNDNDATFESLSHGVNVTGIAAATTDNITGIAGVGFNCSFLPVKISDAAGILTSAYQGVVYAADHNAAIINCSWGSFTSGQFQQDVINYALNKGCLIVAAVGNNDLDTKFYPAAYKGVFSVCATEQNDLKKDNSNYGYYVDIAAPGEAMFTTTSMGTYATNGGTSMAAPVVSGAAALVKAKYPAYTANQIKALLKVTADNIYAQNTAYQYKLGSGRINLFNAISASNPQYLSVIYDSLFDNNDNNFYADDTLYLYSEFQNMLAPINGASVQLVSLSPFATVLNNTFSIAALNTLDITNNTGNEFKIVFDDNTPQNENITLQYKITVNGNTYYEYVDFTLNPDYITVGINNITTTFTSNGRIGFADASNNKGVGFLYNNENLLYEAGLMISDDPSRVADCVRGDNGTNFDFSSLIPVHYSTNAVAPATLDGMMEDFYLSNRINLTVWHNEYVYTDVPRSNFVITSYTVKNNNTVTLPNLYVGLFADWDIKNAYENKAGADILRKLSYCYSTSDSMYAGIMILNNVPFNTYNIDNVSGGNGGVDIYSGFSESEKYTTLTQMHAFAGNTNMQGNDVCQVVSSGVSNFAPNSEFTVVFALLAADSLQQLKQIADSAQYYYNLSPVNVQNIKQNNLNIITLYPNPTSGLFTLNGLDSKKPFSIDIISPEGKLMFTVDNKNTFNLKNYAKGLYLIKIRQEENIWIKKLLLF
jgi:subtilisin family serine protease